MCTALALGIAAGGSTAVTGIMQQNRQHKAQVDAVNRSNAIARQKYLNDITISAYNDQRKGEVFTAQLQADAASRTAFTDKELTKLKLIGLVNLLNKSFVKKLLNLYFQVKKT